MVRVPTKSETLEEIERECMFCLGMFGAEEHRGILRSDVCVCCYNDAKDIGYVPQLLHVDTCLECWERD